MKAKLEAIKKDITLMPVDAIVNAANSSLLGGGGVDGAIHRAAGHELYLACEKLNGCPAGQAKITPGFNLPAKHVIHTVGPIWRGGKENEDQILKSCYENSLKLAVENGIKSVAFPSISTGAYRFPLERAAKIAVFTTKKFLENEDFIDEVYFVCFDYDTLEIYKSLLNRND